MNRLRLWAKRKRRWNYWMWAFYFIFILWMLGFILPILDSLHTFKVYEFPDHKKFHIVEKVKFLGFEEINHYFTKK